MTRDNHRPIPGVGDAYRKDSGLSRDVLDRAVKAAASAATEQNHFIHGFQPDDFEPMRGPDGEVLSSFDAGVSAAAPVIVAAAVKEERERMRAEIEALVPLEVWADAMREGFKAARVLALRAVNTTQEEGESR